MSLCLQSVEWSKPGNNPTLCPCAFAECRMEFACLVSEEGVYRAGNLSGEPDILIYCSDGVLAACQVAFR